MKTTYRGIDYGLGKTNINTKTGIRYGVIPVNACYEFIYDDFEAQYGDPSCPNCQLTVTDSSEKDYRCETCNSFWYSDQCFPESPDCYELERDGYVAAFGSECIDIFVTDSPYYTRAAFCSPCAPGACYLTSPCDDGEKAYCLGHEFFDGGTAPYPVYRVSDDTIVQPTAK